MLPPFVSIFFQFYKKIKLKQGTKVPSRSLLFPPVFFKKWEKKDKPQY